MRLRQLAISQSVMFFAPPEVHQSILNLRSKGVRPIIDSHDVVSWLLEQTCCSIEQLQPLYISQGLEYCRRRLAEQRYPEASSQQDQRKAYLKVLEQPEQYSLENQISASRCHGSPGDSRLRRKAQRDEEGVQKHWRCRSGVNTSGYVFSKYMYMQCSSPMNICRTVMIRQLTLVFSRGRAGEGSPD